MYVLKSSDYTSPHQSTLSGVHVRMYVCVYVCMCVCVCASYIELVH